MNYNYAKFHAFIKKLTIDVIFRWYFMCCKLTLPQVLAVEHCPPPTYTDYVLYIYIQISDIGGLLIPGGGGEECFIKSFRFWLIK